MKIKVCIPHYFSTIKKEFPHGSFSGNIKKRSRSFSRCLLSLINSCKYNDYLVLDMRSNNLCRIENSIKKCQIDITVITDGKNVCQNVLKKYKNYISIVEFKDKDPKELVFEARDHLLNENDFDLYLYCEDDIGINDKKFFDKVKWFAEKTNYSGVLMPHRFERPHSPDIEKIYIDGPINQNLLLNFMIPKMNSLSLRYNTKAINFNNPMNPHSGIFCLTKEQKNLIIDNGIERRNDFVSSLESACTLTAMQFFDIYKTDWKYRTFLEVEHYYTNYC